MLQSGRPIRGRYSPEEVRVLVEEFQELNERPRLWVLVRLLDLKIALRRLPEPLLLAVIVCGVLGYTVRETERVLGVSKSTAQRRYIRGLELLTTTMNGGV